MNQAARKQTSFPQPASGGKLSVEQIAVDRLGVVQAEIAPLKTEEEQLKNMLRATGLDVIEGELFRATISAGEPPVKVDWEAVANDLAAKLKIGQKAYGNVINKHTHVGEAGKARVTVKARKGV